MSYRPRWIDTVGQIVVRDDDERDAPVFGRLVRLVDEDHVIVSWPDGERVELISWLVPCFGRR